MKKDQKKQLKQASHALKPVIITGQNGLTPAVHSEIDNALNTHELIKIRVNADDREERKAMTNEIVSQHNAELINQIGHIIVIYRQNPEK